MLAIPTRITLLDYRHLARLFAFKVILVVLVKNNILYLLFLVERRYADLWVVLVKVASA